MQRGDLVTVALAGDFGKPRPALVIQSDLFCEHGTVTVLLITGTLVEAPLLRITLSPDSRNRLEKPSQIMIDKTITVRRERLGPVFGHIDPATLREVSRTLAVFLGVV